MLNLSFPLKKKQQPRDYGVRNGYENENLSSDQGEDELSDREAWEKGVESSSMDGEENADIEQHGYMDDNGRFHF